MKLMTNRNTLQGALVALLALALSACLLAPGRFTSELDIRKDGRFTFTYVGEIHMLALSKLAQSGSKSEEFKPETCFTEDLDERPCTDEEIANQKSEWEDAQKQSSESRKREAESMKALLGGIDPSSPQAAEELAQRLRRQAGWRKVEHKGDGLFVVDYAISGRLDHDFVFPMIERFPMANAFVQIALRQDGTVRIDAPGFGPASSGEPYRGMMDAAASGEEKTSGDPEVDGKFIIRTDGAILANNTDEGPKADPAGKRLEWPVNLRSPAAPTALIKFTP